MKAREIVDHKGNVWKSKIEMCKYYNINWTTYDNRMQKGWSMKDALETPVKCKNIITDHKGNV